MFHNLGVRSWLFDKLEKRHFLWLFVGSNQLAVLGAGGFIVFVFLYPATL